MKTNNCKWCKHLLEEQDGMPPESEYFWLECKKTNYDNLRSFPFKNTKCIKFEKRINKFESVTWDFKLK